MELWGDLISMRRCRVLCKCYALKTTRAYIFKQEDHQIGLQVKIKGSRKAIESYRS